MKTKEEILKEATRRTLNINEGSPLHDAVMKAMEEYAQEQVKLFCQPAVVGRSEQLPSKEDVYSEIKRVTELYYNDDNVRKSAFGLGFSTGVNFVNKDILK